MKTAEPLPWRDWITVALLSAAFAVTVQAVVALADIKAAITEHNKLLNQQSQLTAAYTHVLTQILEGDQPVVSSPTQPTQYPESMPTITPLDY